MQKNLKYVVFGLLFLLPFTHLLAQGDNEVEQSVKSDFVEVALEEYTETVLPLISEVTLKVDEKDIPWIELYNPESTEIDLTGLSVFDDQGYEVKLSGKINPGSYLVVLIPNLSEASKTISLGDSTIWNFDADAELGTSFIDNNGDIVLTYLPTPGRPNVLEPKKPICEKEEVEEQKEETEENNEESKEEFETGNISLNEIFANPEGDEAISEFIELYNNESHAIYLDGWIISDNSKSFSLDGFKIDPFNYLVIKSSTSGIALNNGTESVTLTDPFDLTIDKYSYTITTEGLSWNQGDEWYEAEPSLGKDNNDPEEEEIQEENEEEVNEESEEESEKTQETLLDQIILNELLPNPAGSDNAEWIELYNPTENIIDLFGLKIADASTSFTFSSQIIQPKSFYVLERSLSGIALNNTNESISLLVDEVVTDSFSYESSKENISWARNENNEWLETEIITKGTINEFSEEASNEPIEESDETSAVEPTTDNASVTQAAQIVQRINLDQWESIENGSEVYVIGTVSLVPETFSKRQAILQSIINDQAYILELYFHKAEWPELVVGDSVQIKGEKSETQTGSRLLIRSTDDIIKLSSGTDPIISGENLNLSSLKDNSLISISGTIMEVQKKQILLDYNNTEIEIDLSKLESIKISFEPNQTLQVTGIFQDKNNKSTITPRSNDDLVLSEIIQPEEIISNDEQIVVPEEPHKQTPPTALYFALGTSATSLGFFVTKYKEQALSILASTFDKIKKS